MGLPSGYLCPSGFTTSDGGMLCVPMTSLMAATFLLTAEGSCDTDTKQTVKDAITDYLKNPSTAFGKWAST
jgi:hypothetical protein